MSSIRTTAEKIAYKYLDRTFGSAKLQADIEQALRDERERAAKIAEKWIDGRALQRGTAGLIADQIRDGQSVVDDEFTIVAQAVTDARNVQEFIWAEQSRVNRPYNPEEWRRLFQKRVDAIGGIDPASESALVELRKRLLQQAALSIKALVAVRRLAAYRDKGVEP